MKNTELFNDRAENYVKYRPHYPEEIIALLREHIGLKKNWHIADIGAGTGISAEHFLNNGNEVFAVEPNEQMREASQKNYQNEKKFHAVAGTAEHTHLPDDCVELIVVAQAFHWFDFVDAKKEFIRIAKPGAYLVMIWNEHAQDNSFQKAYKKLLTQYALRKIPALNIDKNLLTELFNPNPYFFHTLENKQIFDFEALKGRLLSSSYAPQEGDDKYQPMIDSLKDVFNEYSSNGTVAYEYNCHVIYGRLPEPDINF